MIFITGATGLLGSFICRDLLKKGHKVRAIKRQNSRMTLLEDITDQIDWVVGNMDNTSFLEEALQGVTAVIHGAAIISFDKRDEPSMFKTNVQGTADLINACLKVGVKNYTHISSVAALGRKTNQININESDRWEGTEYDSIYSRSKHLSELEVWRGAQEGLEVKIVNPSVVLGPGIWKKGSTSVFKYGYDEKSYFPSGTVNFVDVRDVSRAIIHLMESDIKNERFVLNGGSMLYKDFFGAIAKSFGKETPKKPAPTFLLKVAVFFEFMRSRITGKGALITADTAKLSQMHYHFENDKIKKFLDFEFTPFTETVDWTVSELKKMHNL